VRVDHRTLEAQEIELNAGRRIGFARARLRESALPAHVQARLSEQRQIAHDNGEMIAADPTVALRALTHERPIFSRQQLERFLRSRTADAAQFERAREAVMGCRDFVPLDADSPAGRCTSRDLLEAEHSLKRRAVAMAARRGHAVDVARCTALLERSPALRPLEGALQDLISAGDFKTLALSADDQAAVLGAARGLWAEMGFEVLDAPSMGVPPPLHRASVLVIDDCRSRRLKEVERHVAAADHARSLAVLVGASFSLLP
jgi:hypothetical protein